MTIKLARNTRLIVSRHTKLSQVICSLNWDCQAGNGGDYTDKHAQIDRLNYASVSKGRLRCRYATRSLHAFNQVAERRYRPIVPASVASNGQLSRLIKEHHR